MLICALSVSFICILMLLILSLHQERTDRNVVGMKLRGFWKWNIIIGNNEAEKRQRNGALEHYFFSSSLFVNEQALACCLHVMSLNNKDNTFGFLVQD